AINSSFVLSQVDNSSLFEPFGSPAGKEKSLYLRVVNLNFMRNNEYFTPIVQGQTFFGYQIAPSLVYFPTERIRVEAGVFVRKDFGTQDYTQIAPIFSFSYRKDATSITFGNLEGNLQHNLIEPLYAFERTLTNYLENGFQILHRGEKLDLDAWVDWQQATFPQASRQEHIWAGAKVEFNLIKFKNPLMKDYFAVYPPLPYSVLKASIQATTFHQGGQNINLPTPTPATNSFQLAGGLCYKHPKWHAEAYYVRTIRELYPDTTLTVRTGNGFYAQIGTKIKKKLQVVLSYWQGNGVDNVLGGDLYKSFPTYPKGAVQMDRRLLLLRLSKAWKLADNIDLTARLEPYYDFVNQRVEQVQMLFISFRPMFQLKK
ncbi:MAG: hypothetical protein EAZ95_20590, partial [Bacteroidetes bacterium]